MYRNRFVQIRHEGRRLLGMMLSMIRLHRIVFVSIDGVAVVRKRRRLFANLIISPGNLFLKMTGSPMIVLPQTRWFDWERAIEASTRRNLVLDASPVPTGKGKDLLCRSVPGISLRQVLADSSSSPEQKFNAIRWSLISLRLLHQNVADWGHGMHQSISHGDATTNNVIVDINNRSACWIDFDTRHQPRVSEADRRTDDLRSLIYSAAVDLPASSFPDLADILLAAQFDDGVIQHFRRRLTNEWSHLTTAQLAQAPLRWSRATALGTALVQALAAERRADPRVRSLLGPAGQIPTRPDR
jgi:hypothetical protein